MIVGLALSPATALILVADPASESALTVDPNGRVGFTRMPSTTTGVTFTNRLSQVTLASNRLLEIGSGVALGDVDGDGLVDLYFCRTEGPNVLYRNRGQWKFTDITDTAGVACPDQFSTGAVLVDFDGDGDLDLLVNSLGGGTRAFLNDGQAKFSELIESGLARQLGATSMALADVDGDGDLDLYVTNYRTDTFHDHSRSIRIQTRARPDGGTDVEPAERFLGLTMLTGGLEVLEKGEPDLLYINREGKRFVATPWEVGVFLDEDGVALKGPPTDWGLAVIFRDLNGDGLPDLYVCNDFVYWPDRIWLNQGGRRFRAAPRTAFRNVSLASMAVDVADINRDGFDDLFVADMLSPRREFRAWQRPDTLAGTVVWPHADPNFRPEVPRNTLHLARGNGTFAEIARLAGLSATDWTWSAAFLDVDLDGWEDLLVTTGTGHDVQDIDVNREIARGGGWKTREQRMQDLERLPARATPSMAFRNRHDLTFEDRSAQWGFAEVGVAHGMALGDLDNDGDLDVVINCLNAPARLLRNESPAPRLAVRLRGAKKNSQGIGARIKVTGGPVTQTQEIMAGGRYLSGDDALRVFAAGEVKTLDIEVTWRSGQRSRLKGAKPNHLYVIAETDTEAVTTAEALPKPLFRNLSEGFHHVHTDAAFDDFARQPLLPRRLSTLGPGVGWVDLDGDGDDDLVVGGGRQGRPSLWKNDGRGGLTEWTGSATLQANARAQTGVVAGRKVNGAPGLLLGESNWEDDATHTAVARVLFFEEGAEAEIARPSGHNASSGPLALADVDGDGDLDLFVGGRALAGRYPEPADSQLFLQEGGAFRPAQSFPKLGLVSGAIFTDYDQDGDPDLALACDWDSIRVFRNNGGKFEEVTRELGLAEFKGCWNGMAVGDFDGDGRLDLVASNWGRNGRTDVPPAGELPAWLFYGDFAGNGGVQTVLASWDPHLSFVTPWRDWSSLRAAIPAVGERLTNHHHYGGADIATVLGRPVSSLAQLPINTFDSMVFLNRGDRFEPRRLPNEAQFAPAFGISVADFDGDGFEDVFLAQNFFGTDAETSRHDAGVGLVLRGDGKGGFHALSPLESGISLYGEQRGSAVADFDGDGRTDLVVAQHSGPTQLFRNEGGTPGRRVKLRDGPENPDAIGAVLRLKSGEKWGPVRELHAGGGYWSQDSSTVVLGAPGTPTALEVRWPGGQVQEFAWPADAHSVMVSSEGIFPR